MADKEPRDKKNFRLEVPFDASGIEDFDPNAQQLKAVVYPCDGLPVEQAIRLSKDGKGSAVFTFASNPGALTLRVGPADATAEELRGMQTLSLEVSSRQWGDKPALSLAPLGISSYFWYWWLYWCRTFTIRGRVLCPDGSPAPGAKVCAYDVDWWFIWSSTQLVGCATTDLTGAFEIKFRWCCGWWPWWWWLLRVWRLDPDIAAKVGPVLKQSPDVRLSPVTGNQPSLSVFKELLVQEGLNLDRPLGPEDVNRLEGIREKLLQKLPASPELERLRIWPWWPWGPWWDCAPDIIFRVTQDCITPGTVIYDEGITDTRWNIPTLLNVTLIANSEACCIPGCPDPHCCPDGECIVISQVCGDPINEIGGNPGAPVAPAGYFNPGAVLPGTAAYNGDRPYAGTIPIEKNFGDMLNVDYYEIEYFSGGSWGPLPPGAAQDFKRRWLETPGFTTGDVPFPFTSISGHNVVESREHFESTGGLAGWNATRFWIANRELVVPLDTTKFPDGTYQFHVVGWQISGGGLINPRVLPVCGTEKDNELVLTLDNRVIDALTHPASHNCGGVHICTVEPDTSIDAVRINGTLVQPCDTIDANEGNLEIDFSVTDPDGHLAVYTLIATYGLNLSVDLLNQPGSVLAPIIVGTPYGPTYGQALGQGAVAPHWYGGSFRLTVPVSQAFPEPCCYQLELRGWKRTIVGGQTGIVYNCEHNYAYGNLTEYTLGVGVC